MPMQQEIIQAARFEYGIRPSEVRFSGGILAQLDGPDPMDAALPVIRTADRVQRVMGLRRLRGQDREAFLKARRELRQVAARDMMQLLARAVENPLGFRERVFAFWLDHFTVTPQQAEASYMLAAYFEDAIRPHIAGRFADMLKAVIGHPSMLFYLGQNQSVGPNSPIGQRREKGLNENLARELLELHTLGVDGPYSQDDVRQIAELLTGLNIGEEGTRFSGNQAEPGAEVIFGKSYGGGRPRVQDIYEFLEDLAMMPATARHLAGKLIVHFIGPAPQPQLQEEMASAYLESGGELRALYEPLIAHPAAVSDNFPKVRPPFEYVVTVLRALDFSAEGILNARQKVAGPLQKALTAMGQKPFQPNGPDGWPEEAENWINPPQLAARIAWVGQLAHTYASDRDPRALMEALLGETAPDFLSFAVSGAETKWEGLSLLLVSPALMRR